MTLTPSQAAVILIGLLHSAFAFGELWPWESPLIMQAVLKKWLKQHGLQGGENNLKPEQNRLISMQNRLISMIVHNAGIYNGIVGAALFVSLFAGSQALPIQLSLLIGGIVAGIFGAITLTKATIIQAILGAIAVAVVLTSSSRARPVSSDSNFCQTSGWLQVLPAPYSAGLAVTVSHHGSAENNPRRCDWALSRLASSRVPAPRVS